MVTSNNPFTTYARILYEDKVFMSFASEDLNQSELEVKRHGASKIQSASVCKS
jgi:hypothetical protein